MGKPFGEASRRTFGRIGTLVAFPCWNSLGVMSSDTLKFSKQPPSEALKGGLPVSVLQLSGIHSPLSSVALSSSYRLLFADHCPKWSFSPKTNFNKKARQSQGMTGFLQDKNALCWLNPIRF